VGTAFAVVPPLVATGAAVAGQAGAPLWVLVGLSVLGGGVLAGSGAYKLWDERRVGEAARRSELGALVRTGLPVPTVANVDPYGTLSVFQSTLTARVGQDRPPYVSRDNDDGLRRLLSAPETGMVVVRGVAKAGKKRSAFEALQVCCGDRPVVVPVRPGPAAPRPLRRLLELGLPVSEEVPPPVLWLENADRHSEAGDLDLDLLRQIREHHPGLLVVATLRFGAVADADTLTRQGQAEAARQARGHEQVWVDIEAQPWVVQHDVATGLSPAELVEGRQAYPSFADREEFARGLGPFFAGSDQLLRRLREGRGAKPLGVSLVEAVATCRRGGLDEPVAGDIVRALVVRRLRAQGIAAPDLSSYDDAVEWASTPVESGARLLSLSEVAASSSGYSTPDEIFDALVPDPGRPSSELQAAIELLQAVTGLRASDHLDTLTTRHNIAVWTGETGDAREALRLLQELLPDLERVLGADHPDTLAGRHNIAVWTGETGDAREALRLLQELLPDRERVLGADHPDTQAVRAFIDRHHPD
jgi:hypothetical protein